MIKRIAAMLLAALTTLCAPVFPARAEEDGPLLRSLEEVLLYIFYDCAYMLADEITFRYDENLDEVFATADALWDMQDNCGVLEWTQTRYTDQRKVKIEDIVYMPGFRAAQAWTLEMMDVLTAEEREILEIAQRIVEEERMYSPSPFDMMVRLHDALVRRVTYMEREEDGYWDTAVGALKYGSAECDGYTDAYYLLGTLAGQLVGYQTGDADGESHIWNVVFWDGWWYHVDVTWDDRDVEGYPDMATYRYFMVGGDSLPEHRWDARWTANTLATYNNWDYFYYTCDSSGMTYGAYYETMENAANYAAYLLNSGYRQVHVMVKGEYEDAVTFNDLVSGKITGTAKSWTTWTEHMGEYTVYDLTLR